MGNSPLSSETPMRSNGCGDLRDTHIDETVQLCGWVDRRRDHGGVIFIDLRDRSGTVQITVDPDLGADAFAVAEHLRSETVLQVQGKVRARSRRLSFMRLRRRSKKR